MNLIYLLTALLISSTAMAAPPAVGCNYLETFRCGDYLAINKMQCGAIEGYVRNNTPVESITINIILRMSPLELLP